MAQTTPPSITAAPTPAPSRADRTTFSTRVDAFVTWLIAAVAELQALATNVYNNAVDGYNSSVASAASASNAATQLSLATTQAGLAAASATSAIASPGTNATSTTSLAVGTGTKSLTIQTGKELVVGMTVNIARTSDPALSNMSGIITSYTTGTGALIVEVSSATGTGTYTDWTISLSGTKGLAGDSMTTHNYFIGQI